jgi:hypothetical protein
MANSNFVVHNGLTVGPLTIEASSGNLTTSGSANIAGRLDVIGDLSVTGNIAIAGDLGVDQISKNDSSISINDTGSGSTVVVAIDGSTRANISSTGLDLTGTMSATSVTIDGKIAATVDDATALSIALGG